MMLTPLSNDTGFMKRAGKAAASIGMVIALVIAPQLSSAQSARPLNRGFSDTEYSDAASKTAQAVAKNCFAHSQFTMVAFGGRQKGLSLEQVAKMANVERGSRKWEAIVLAYQIKSVTDERMAKQFAECMRIGMRLMGLSAAVH